MLTWKLCKSIIHDIIIPYNNFEFAVGFDVIIYRIGPFIRKIKKFNGNIYKLNSLKDYNIKTCLDITSYESKGLKHVWDENFDKCYFYEFIFKIDPISVSYKEGREFFRI